MRLLNRCWPPMWPLIIVECAFGDRPFLFTQDGNWQHVRVRTWDELWIKENLFNLGVRRAETDYIAFLDGDIHFTRDDWAEETVEQLQHYMVVQPWSYAVNLGPNRDATTRHSSFCYDWVTKGCAMYKPERIGYAPHIGPDFYWHPGLAWAWRREALDAVGGLLEVDILGGGDLHMAKCLIGQYGETFVNFGTSDPRDVATGYRTAVSAWQDRCSTFIKKDIGYWNGTITHHWHGPVWARYYETKWKIVTSNKYDPLLHLQHSSQGRPRMDPPGQPAIQGRRAQLLSSQERGRTFISKMAVPSHPAAQLGDSYSEVSFVSKPNPDPTERTEAQLHRQVNGLHEKLSLPLMRCGNLIFERIDGKVGTLVATLDGNRNSTNSKLEGVEKQFLELDVRTERNAALAKEAVAAALQAQKESVGAQNNAIAQSNEKMETSFTKQIDQQAASIKALEKTGDDKVDDLKDRMASLDSRIQAIESRKEGVVEQRIGTILNISMVIAAIGIIAGIAIAVMSHH